MFSAWLMRRWKCEHLFRTKSQENHLSESDDSCIGKQRDNGEFLVASQNLNDLNGLSYEKKKHEHIYKKNEEKYQLECTWLYKQNSNAITDIDFHRCLYSSLNKLSLTINNHHVLRLRFIASHTAMRVPLAYFSNWKKNNHILHNSWINLKKTDF